ncbi:hypothetical protein F2Q69_00013497 [Brassica cretica]|uniref:Uncharacterized protein n=1 Tax=Brassica cretica TaxID=69181 RepID=A0A8S9R529_BRACR|nr:hypothetical protein F2Q69_00013497 [Brassica cretica]
MIQYLAVAQRLIKKSKSYKPTQIPWEQNWVYLLGGERRANDAEPRPTRQKKRGRSAKKLVLPARRRQNVQQESQNHDLPARGLGSTTSRKKQQGNSPPGGKDPIRSSRCEGQAPIGCKIAKGKGAVLGTGPGILCRGEPGFLLAGILGTGFDPYCSISSSNSGITCALKSTGVAHSQQASLRHRSSSSAIPGDGKLWSSDVSRGGTGVETGLNAGVNGEVPDGVQGSLESFGPRL